jgi:phosphoribosylformylglycinamidine synthase
MIGNEIPRIDLATLPQVLRGVYEAIQSGTVHACHDVSQGGVISAVAEMTFGGDCGAEITLETDSRPDFFLFNETAGTFILEVPDEESAAALFAELPYQVLGKTRAEKTLTVRSGDETLFAIPTDDLREAWQAPEREVFA